MKEDLGRLIDVWQMHGPGSNRLLVRKLKRLMEEAVQNLDSKFFRKLAAEIEQKKRSFLERPHRIEPVEKIRSAYLKLLSLHPEVREVREILIEQGIPPQGMFGAALPTFSAIERPFEILNKEFLRRLPFTWSDVKKETGLEASDREWRRWRKEAGLSGLPNRAPGRPRNRGQKK